MYAVAVANPLALCDIRWMQGCDSKVGKKVTKTKEEEQKKRKRALLLDHLMPGTGEATAMS